MPKQSENKNPYTTVNFYDVLDKKATILNIRKALSAYKAQWLKSHKSGGVTDTTFDVAHALLLCIAPTMEDIRQHQPETLIPFCKEGRLFMFGTRKSIAACVADRKEDFMQNCRPSARTVFNQINTLLKASILTEKRNYRVINQNNTKNPLPSDFCPTGRGRFQLVFSEQILVFKKKFQGLFLPSKSIIRKSLPLDSTSTIINSKELKTNINTESNVDKSTKCIDKKVFATAHEGANHVKGKERGHKLISKSQVSDHKKDPYQNKTFHQTQSDYVLSELFELLRSEIYGGKGFSPDEAQTTKIALSGRLQALEIEIRAYRAKQIQDYKASDHFNQLKRPDIGLKFFTKKLPNIEKSAVQVLTHAILKQAKHAKTKGYLHKLGNPSDLVSSPVNFTHAVSMSMNDWTKMQQYYRNKKDKLTHYFQYEHRIAAAYMDILQYSQQNKEIAYERAVKALISMNTALQKSTLSESNKASLKTSFKTRLTPLFRDLPEHRKSTITKLIKNGKSIISQI
jgi:hypothetical protein